MTSPLIEIFNEWQNNLKFREAFKTNPSLAIKEAGFIISPEDLVKVEAMVKLNKSDNESLEDRISK